MMIALKLLAVVLALTALCMGYYARRLARRFDTIQKMKEDYIFAEKQYDNETIRTLVFIVFVVVLLFAVVYLAALCYKHNIL